MLSCFVLVAALLCSQVRVSDLCGTSRRSLSCCFFSLIAMLALCRCFRRMMQGKLHMLVMLSRISPSNIHLAESHITCSLMLMSGRAVAKDLTLGQVSVSVLGTDGSTAFSSEGAAPSQLLSTQPLTAGQLLEVGPPLRMLTVSMTPLILTEAQACQHMLLHYQLHPDHSCSPPQVALAPKSGGQAFKPQQVMLRLSNVASGVSAYAVGKVKKDGTYTITVGAGAIKKQIGEQVCMVAGCRGVCGINPAPHTLPSRAPDQDVL